MESFWLSKVLKNYIFYTAGHARKLHLKLRHHVLISSILSIIGRFKTIIYRILNLYSIRYTDTIIDLYRCFGIGCPTLGWTSEEHDLAWLEQIFNKETKSKAGRSWRLLFVDGHSSHLNMKFTERCHELRILLVYYPPHSTHRLQPLDVSCFNPLANYYSQGLKDLIMQSAGLTEIRKRDFFSLFWTAYEKTFNKKIIGSAFEKTGIWPFNPSIVPDKLPTKPTTPPPDSDQRKHGSSSPPAVLETPTRDRKIRHFVNRVSAKAD